MRVNDGDGASEQRLEEISGLRVGSENVHHSVYTNPKVFDAEVSQLFSRAWMLLGHESQIPQAGDYFLGHIGTVPVIVVRDRDLKIQVLENRCAHRAAAVCTQPSGRGARAFICPYHGWTYNLDGSLRGLPFPSDYGESFVRAARGLPCARRVDSYRGFIFASLARDAPDLESFLGAATLSFDNFVDRSPSGEIELVSAPLRHLIRANWKLVMENLNDVIHPLFAHASVGAAGRSLTSNTSSASQLLAQDPARIFEALKAVTTVSTRFGHSFQEGLERMTGTGRRGRTALKPVLSGAVGEARAEQILNTDTYVAVIYPSVLVKAGSQSLRILRPISAAETEVSSYVFRLKGAPAEVLQDACEYHYSLGSPASPVFSDDLHIYELIQADYKRDYLISTERALGDGEAADCERTSATSEAYIRGQYRAWQRYMSGEWP